MTGLETILAAALPVPIKQFFAVDVTYTSPTGTYIAAVKMIRRKPSQDEQQFAGRNMKFRVFAADLSELPERGGRITLDGEEYKIVDVDAGAVMHGMTAVLS